MDGTIVVGYLVGFSGLLIAAATFGWKIATHAFTERLKAAEEREKEYKEKTSRIPEFEKTINELKKQVEKHNRKEQFEFQECNGYYTFNGERYCPICLNFKNIEMPLVSRGVGKNGWIFYCSNCDKNFPPE